MNHRAKNYFSHQWQNGSGNIGISHDPATWQPVAEYSCATTAEFETGVSAARHAFDCGTWPHQPRLRAEILYEFAELLQARSREIEPVLVQLNGKLIKEARGEIGAAISELKYYAGLARNLWGRVAEIDSGCYSLIAREGAGVVGIIVPWNAPVTLLIRSLAPALAAGCTVVLKVAHQTSLVHQMVLECLTDISSLPQDIVCSFVEDGADISKRMCEHPLIDVISFTGSSQTGKKIAASSSGTLKRLSLELGGKAPVVVFADADLAAAAEAIAIAGYFNAGQDCTAATRVIVQDSVYDEFVALLTEQAKAVAIGAPADEDVFLGPVNNVNQLARVSDLLSRVPSHAQVMTGGSALDRPGFFFPATVVAGLRQDDELIQKEIFGPVITVQKFSDEAQAVSMANGVDYGLASSVWTANHGTAMRMAKAFDFGCVWINTHIPLVAEMPHGGFKRSGYGKDLSGYGFEDYTRIKHVMTNLGA